MADTKLTFRTREQRMADAVFILVNKKSSKSDKEKKEYGSMAHKLPVLIRTAGLAQALAFVEARGKSGHKGLLNDLSNVVQSEYDPNNGTFTLVEKSHSAAFQEYILLTQYSLDALLWFKRFAQTILKVDAAEAMEDSDDSIS